MAEPGIVVVGGGECGARAAFALRQRGWTGPVTIVGREALPAYERPPLSKAALAGDGWAPAHPWAEADYRAAGIGLRLGPEAVGVDADRHRLVLADGGALAYDRLLLAVGARARRLPVPGVVSTLRTPADARRIREGLGPSRRVVVVGAGLIGLEVAAAAVGRGCRVTVVEAAERALGRAVPAPVAAAAVALHEERGVRFHWSASVEGVEPAGAGWVVRLPGGLTLPADTVVAGVGAVPDVDVAAASGLDVADGIVVDEYLRTSAPDVYAAGDCAAVHHPLFPGPPLRVESWRSAHDQAVCAAANLTGAGQAHTAVPWFWSDQYDHTLQVAGVPGRAALDVARRRPDGVELWFGLDGSGRLLSAAGIGPGGAVARDVRLAERLIHRQARPSPDQLADPAVPLKDLLAAVPAGAAP